MAGRIGYVVNAALALQSLPFRQTIPFPRPVIKKFLADEARAVPGTKIESPPFEAFENQWQLNLYPFGGNADPYFAGRVGVYLRLLLSLD